MDVESRATLVYEDRLACREYLITLVRSVWFAFAFFCRPARHQAGPDLPCGLRKEFSSISSPSRHLQPVEDRSTGGRGVVRGLDDYSKPRLAWIPI